MMHSADAIDRANNAGHAALIGYLPVGFPTVEDLSLIHISEPTRPY